MTENQVLEQGDIYFVYRPRVEHEQVRDLEDVQQLYMILHSGGGRVRRIVIGRKQLPEPGVHDRFWGFVDEVATRPEAVAADLGEQTYPTGTRGERTAPRARPAGEGQYAIVRHGDHTHLAYQLELPQDPGAAQQQLHVEPEASYIVAVKNPEVPSPAGAGLGPGQRAELPADLQERFGGRRFVSADPDLLDHERVEFVLIGAAEDAEYELGIELDPEPESLRSAEIFRRFGMSRDVPTGPLTEGEWR